MIMLFDILLGISIVAAAGLLLYWKKKKVI
jgi:LPXTG-motif cell wall-anchored protein